MLKPILCACINKIVMVLREGKDPHFTTLASNSTHKTEKRHTDGALILSPSGV